ncbi:MAG: hypothetical protein E7672_04270 [Ruminococcaceae bacterium]|nr:hypothetical protein [Oscillospiraceae bacterium]
MKKYLRISFPISNKSSLVACILMFLSTLIRIIHFIPKEIDTFSFFVHLLMPVLAAFLFLLGMTVLRKNTLVLSISSVFIGVVFFIIKAFSFTPIHQTLCTILYLVVLTIYTLTVLGYLPDKRILYLLFGLPLLYHIFVEDTQLYIFADPPVPFWEWLPEISVLLIVGALLAHSIGMKQEKLK